MYKIRKRDAPALRKGILRKSPKTSNNSRKVGFVDEIGKPLVEYRDLPQKMEANSTGSVHHEKTSGHFMTTHKYDNRIMNGVTWNVMPVKNATPPKECCSEIRSIEEKRLEENNISRAPLFGTFDAFDPPHLALDAVLRARIPVPIIPIECVVSQQTVQQIQPSNHAYEQNFETRDQQTSQNSPELQSNGGVLNLMARLKERGLLPSEQFALSSATTTPMKQSAHSISPGNTPFARKTNRLCTYYINRPSGCNHGDSCRYEHNDVERERHQQKLQKSRNDSRRHRPTRPMRASYGDDRKRSHRSRSP